jgi:GntR family transcriptional regulator/MocR family aminotransferase
LQSPIVGLTIDPTSKDTITKQIYDHVRRMVLSGSISPGSRLPSSRNLAGQVGISRNTVLAAYDQLTAEAYLEGRVGSGTFVVRNLPDAFLRAQLRPMPARELTGERERTSRQSGISAALAIAPKTHAKSIRAFRTGLPDADAFPFQLWARLVSRRYRDRAPELFDYQDPAGYGPLREEIARYLSNTRGLRCNPEQVIVVGGSQQALDLAMRLLIGPGDVVCVEDPGYAGTLAAVRGSAARVVPIPIDGEGFEVAVARRRAPDARLIVVTPSRQYPLGVTMSLVRRLELLEWASQTNAWILEDDYDSEYRYEGLPLAALQGLDNEGRVIYMGTFSRLMFPTLRLGYAVVPPDLVDSFRSARALSDRGSSWVEQSAMVEFISDGHFARHVRRMRALYAKRQAKMVAEAERQLAGLLDVRTEPAGMHLIGWLPEGQDDLLASGAVARLGVEAEPLSALSVEPLGRGGLMMGYTGVTDSEIEDGVAAMAEALGGLGPNSEVR